MDLDRDHAHTFLAYVFTGRPGWLQIVDSGRNFYGQTFTTDAAGIAAAVDYAAARDRDRPRGIYFRATTMDTPRPLKADGRPGRGGAECTAAVPLLWGDVDFGEDGHKGENLPPDQAAAERVIAESGVGTTHMTVHSGGGLYPFWMPSTELQVDQAAELSERVQALLLQASEPHGWAYGTGVSDLARVLRLPGSINRKTDVERPCRVIGGTGEMLDVTTVPHPRPVEPTAARPRDARPLPPRRDPATLDPNRDRGPADVVDEMCSWADILEPAGWTFVASESDGAERWLRPGGASSEYSARAFEHNLVCWSEATKLPSGKERRLTKARVYAYLWHGGDVSEAVRALLRGDNRGGLPLAVLDEIQRAAAERDAQLWAQVGVTRKLNTPAAAGDAETPTGPATAAEVAAFLATYTRYTRPDVLGRRVAWAKADPGYRQASHARRMVADVLDGLYPAERAAAAIADIHRHHRGTDPGAPRYILSVALGAVLNAKVSA